MGGTKYQQCLRLTSFLFDVPIIGHITLATGQVIVRYDVLLFRMVQRVVGNGLRENRLSRVTREAHEVRYVEQKKL